jgi:hypothetical protein
MRLGKILIILGIIFIVIFIAFAGVGYYLYNYHVFNTIRICIPEASQELLLECSNDRECFAIFQGDQEQLEKSVSGFPAEIRGQIKNLINQAITQMNTSMTDDMPEIFRETVDEVFENALYCSNASESISPFVQKTCKIRDLSNLGKQMIGDGEECKQGEKEIVKDIYGKDYLEFLQFARKSSY